MRRKYTAEERRVWNKRYYDKKLKLGWVNCSFHVPKSVGATLEKLKCELMACYKSEHPTTEELAIKVKTGTNKLIFYSFKQVAVESEPSANEKAISPPIQKENPDSHNSAAKKNCQ